MPQQVCARKGRLLTTTLLSLVVACIVVSPATVWATTLTYRVGIDVGNDPSAGCDFSLGSVPPGTLPGFELQVTVLVNDALTPPAVTSAILHTCNGAVFADPQPLAGFVLELDGGFLGADSIIGSIPLSLLGDASSARFAYYARSTRINFDGPFDDESEDALFTRDGTSEGAPIILQLRIEASPVPTLSGFGTFFALVVLLALVRMQWRSGRWSRVAASAAMLAVTGALIVNAEFGEPAALDVLDDSTLLGGSDHETRAEIFAAFLMVTDTELMLRLDVEDIPFETDCDDGLDNDGDLLIDCIELSCLHRPCDDTDACTVNDICIDFATCSSEPKDCSDGNECTVDVCAPGGVCSHAFDDSKTEFGDCTPEANCNARNSDGQCVDVADDCVVGRCVEGGAPTSVTCESADRAGLPVDQGGCDDGSDCTVDTCVDGECSNDAFETDCDDGVDNDCDGDIDGDDSDCGFLVFATSALTAGDFGGLAGGDAICNALASNAALPGTFVAFLSDSNTDAADRISNDGPWYLVSTFPLGKVVDSKADLLDGTIDTNIILDENNLDVSAGLVNRVWTGSTITGTFSNDACSDWASDSSVDKGTTGNIFKSDSDWVDGTDPPCDTEGRLYCFQVSN